MSVFNIKAILRHWSSWNVVEVACMLFLCLKPFGGFSLLKGRSPNSLYSWVPLLLHQAHCGFSLGHGLASAWNTPPSTSEPDEVSPSLEAILQIPWHLPPPASVECGLQVLPLLNLMLMASTAAIVAVSVFNYLITWLPFLLAIGAL